MKRPIIIALDFETDKDCLSFLNNFSDFDEPVFVKIGLQMFTHYGYPFVKKIQDLGHHIFLDLKLNDIPNTVEKTCEVIAKWGVQMLTIHANGGAEMIAAAKRGLTTKENDTKLLAVTQLTSISDKQLEVDFKIPLSSRENVANLAKLAYNNGADGVISSALEVDVVKSATSAEFLCITPGIRPVWAQKNEQKRVMTPAQAKEIGSDGIVVGRPITKNENPIEAYLKIKNEWK